MKNYLVTIRIIEHGRQARIEAESPAEARALARNAEWIDCSDATHSDVFVVGAVEELKEGE